MTRSKETAKQCIDQAQSHWNRGNLDAALRCCREALALDPSNVDALVNTGTLLWIEGDVEAAEKLYLAAHAASPSHVGIMLNIAALRDAAADFDGSWRWVRKAESLRSDNPEVVWRKSLLELAAGDYRNGWEHYEAGLGLESIRGKSPGFGTAPWTGTRCKRLLLWHEQGFGDTLQFIRYAKLCKERVDRVVVLCPRELLAILKSCSFVDDAVDAIDAGEFDQHISIMSLPRLFGTTLATIPGPVPYLHADAALSAAWSTRIRGDRLKVGVAWAGRFRTNQLRFRAIDRSRSLPRGSVPRLLDVENVDFYSLQKGNAGDAASDPADPRLIDCMSGIDDFAGTAAIIANLDLVISVDTSVVHLAGAMGKPVWVLSRADACWRWLRNRPDSPWYPTATVFGQPTPGDWDSVIDSVKHELAKLARRHAPS